MRLPFALPPQDLPVPVEKGRLSVIVTYLEMRTPPAMPKPGAPTAVKTMIMRARHPSVAFYRFLYEAVGEPWLWYDRRRWDDVDLARHVQDSRVEIHVLYVEGSPAGYIELDRRNAPEQVDISYFGLLPDYIGYGLGSWLLAEGVEMAWARGTRRVTVNTCTFDHPAALGVYQKRGFTPIRHVVREIADPRLTGPLPRSAGPHIPIIE